MARITAAKWPAPPSGRSSRSTEVMTTCFRPSLATASATRAGSSASSASGRPVRDVAEAAGAGAGVAHDHHGGVALRPALADVGAGGFLADGDEAVLAHQRPGLVVDRVRRRLDPDPGRLALDRVVWPVRLFRVAQVAMIDQEPGGHVRLQVAGGGGGVKLGVALRASRLHFPIEAVADGFDGGFEFEVSLQVEPEFGGSAEVAGEAQGCIGGEAAPLGDDGLHPGHRDADVLGPAGMRSGPRVS